jgi:hypothetical protein
MVFSYLNAGNRVILQTSKRRSKRELHEASRLCVYGQESNCIGGRGRLPRRKTTSDADSNFAPDGVQLDSAGQVAVCENWPPQTFSLAHGGSHASSPATRRRRMSKSFLRRTKCSKSTLRRIEIILRRGRYRRRSRRAQMELRGECAWRNCE